MEQKRGEIGLGDPQDLAHDDQMIAPVVARRVAALEPRRAFLEDRTVSDTQRVAERTEALIARTREILRKLPLLLAQYVDREMRCTLERRKAP